MILHKNYFTENISKIQKESYKYLLLEIKNFRHREDRYLLEPGIEIANLCNIIRMVNDALDKVGAEKIDFSILGEVLIAVYTDTPFDDNQLEDLFALELRIEKTSLALQSISEMMDEFHIPSEIIRHLIGFGFQKQIEFEEVDEEAYGTCIDEFYDVLDEFLKEETSIKELRKKALELLEGGLQKAKDNKNPKK